jgi:UDP-glucose-4-epimerase GalE
VRILVTGGAGYIGSITTRSLVEAGHEAIVLDTLENGHAWAVDPRAQLVVGSVDDEATLDRILQGVDAVVHLAGYIEVAESQTQPGRYFRNNMARPLVMLDAMVRHGVLKLVFSSTAAVYGDAESIPISEDAPLRPVNAYGFSKLMFEEILDWYGEVHGLRSIRFRYFNASGAWPHGELGEAHDPETHIIPRILQAMARPGAEFEIYGDDYPTPDGTCVRDYIHVLDLAQAHILGLDRLHAGGESGVFNLGSGMGFSNREVLETCIRVAGKVAQVKVGPRRPGDPPTLIASSDLARRVLGWQPLRGSLEQIVQDAWAWHQSRV